MNGSFGKSKQKKLSNCPPIWPINSTPNQKKVDFSLINKKSMNDGIIRGEHKVHDLEAENTFNPLMGSKLSKAQSRIKIESLILLSFESLIQAFKDKYITPVDEFNKFFN